MTVSPLKILIMNRKYDGVFGGVEYMSTTLANEMDARGHQCDLISLDVTNAKMEYKIPKNSKWYKIAQTSCDVKASWKERCNRFFKIRKILKQYHIAIGFQDGAFLSLATAAIGTRIPVIAAERNSPTRFNYTSQGKFKLFTFQSFRLAKKIIVQCESYSNQYPKYLRSKIEVIPNPVFTVDKQSIPAEDQNKKQIVTVGRLSYQKNFEVLITAFSKLPTKFNDWNLIIVGDGENRKKVENLILKNKLNERVILKGYQKDPSPFLLKSQLFCLPSRWEGFPNALSEAMAHGLPCVGFKECSGVSDLINHSKNGLLADGNENSTNLKKVLESLMNDPSLREIMGKQAKKDILKFNPENIFTKWENLFKTTTKH